MSVEIDRPNALQIVLGGGVQGFGVRPAIARLAVELGLVGHVLNDCQGVSIRVEGDRAALDSFCRTLPLRLPPEASLERLRSCPVRSVGASEFQIIEQPDDGPVSARLPLDRKCCGECLEETRRPGNRRFRDAFASCTLCGPRYSVLKSMPYERALSSMAPFSLCRECQDEYDSPADRRFHAQTISCPNCGPRMWCSDRSGNVLGNQQDAIELAARAIEARQIVAARGLGGYQLLCDATSASAVQLLRDRKKRRSKPLAVLVRSLDAAEKLAEIAPWHRAALADSANAIVLIPARRPTCLADNVHPGLREIGLLLPTTPLHALLLDRVDRPVVATSGNREGEPLAPTVEESLSQLADIADLWLHHDRDVVHPIDDSAVRIIEGRPVTIRLARGMAPTPLPLESDRPVLALGGHQKVAVAFSNGRQALLGPHLGDLDSPSMRARFEAHLREMTELLGAEPELLVHDMHPEYHTTRWALEQGLPTLAVQHHHAHIVAGMLEHGWLDREVLGIAFDGTGYGPDGSVWGGEFLICTATSFRRVAHLRPFRLPGGEAAIRAPWRTAVSLMAETQRRDEARRLWKEKSFGDSHADFDRIIAHRRLSPVTTSAGRLFDAVASLVLGIDRSEFDASPAMSLESACSSSDDKVYPHSTTAGSMRILDWAPLLSEMLADLDDHVPAGAIAMRFHRGMSRGIADVCAHFPDLPVVLSGGVFQNRILTELVSRELNRCGREIGLPGTIPPNDGGISAGQLAIALARCRQKGA